MVVCAKNEDKNVFPVWTLQPKRTRKIGLQISKSRQFTFWYLLEHLRNQILKYLTVSPLRRINTFRIHISNLTCVDLLELERVFTGYTNVSN